MKNIIMYTGPMCAFCDAAKRLFKRNNASYKEIDIGNNLEIREEMIKKSNIVKKFIKIIFFWFFKK